MYNQNDRNIFYFFKGAVKYHLTPTHVKEDLVNFRLSEEQAENIASKYKLNFIGLSRTFVGNTLTINQVLDMQWRFGVTTASSESKKAGNTFLQLKLVLDQGNDKKEDVHMELSLPQFYQFLRQMEQAKSSLEYFN
ncbi:COMM domain-containing protein 7 [Cavenderia fasciculata]|uniref:COMM domain-containing protein 7 n=1 Tax=Cavenderia fasciculata TaxID=261658 RepID=F4PWL5_CACFS|nr:COMM domain-containing protein 7 [Cavenderia fasciculata]EGG20379.1 COMM domain-containing protein 7 [Cavenderia fasciculata]|eukprot:XP_004367362.1 COMM domain-containing protein 7 [Cavenderia fasciculata]